MKLGHSQSRRLELSALLGLVRLDCRGIPADLAIRSGQGLVRSLLKYSRLHRGFQKLLDRHFRRFRRFDCKLDRCKRGGSHCCNLDALHNLVASLDRLPQSHKNRPRFRIFLRVRSAELLSEMRYRTKRLCRHACAVGNECTKDFVD